MEKIITTTPPDYKCSTLYKRLDSIDSEHTLTVKVDDLIEKISPLLGTIGDHTFSNFTLHNPIHSQKLLHIAGIILNKEVVEGLSALELAVMIMSFYVHDLGMVVTSDNRSTIIADDDFKRFLRSKSDFSSRIKKLRDEMVNVDGEEKDAYSIAISELYDAALTDYIRPRHASIDRYKELLDSIIEDDSLFSYKGFTFKDELLRICSSHNEDCYTLTKSEAGRPLFKTDQYIAGQKLNCQFCAAVLRIADILDFDYERTPESLFRAIGLEVKKMPGFKVSLKEWQKQMATHTIRISEDAIIVDADSKSPSIEHAIREMCQWIEKEIRDTRSVLQNNSSKIAENYYIELPNRLHCEIRSIGYVYKDYSIKLNERAIINLLMGDNLYAKNQVAIRELVQNAIDACVVRSKIEKRDYKPEINVSILQEDGRYWIVVKDNGIGMDDYVLSNYFFKIGSSYYQSEDFKSYQEKEKITNFTPISRFGIGLLSVFMIGDVVRVTTSNKYSARSDFKSRTLIIDSSESLAVVQESSVFENGTKIEVLLRREMNNGTYITGLLGYLKSAFIRPVVKINVTPLDGKSYSICSKDYLSLNTEAMNTIKQNGVIPIEIDMSKYSEIITGRVFLFLFKNDNGTISYVDPKGKLIWGAYPLKPTSLFNNYNSSSMVTVNGIAMRLNKLGSLLNSKKRIVPFVVDINVSGNSDIEYDVSRTKVRGKGLVILRKELFNSIINALKEGGYYMKLDEQTKKQFKRVAVKNIPSEPLDRVMLDRVESLLPKESFTVNYGLINEVARKVGEKDTELIKKYVYAVANKYKS